MLMEKKIAKIVGNNFVDAKYHLDFDLEEVGIMNMSIILLKEIMENIMMKRAEGCLKDNLDRLIPKHIIIDDMCNH